MSDIFIFSGTTEGRELSEILDSHGISCTVSVATEYGAEVMGKGSLVRLLKGRMDRWEIVRVLKGEDYLCVVDATHPFAVAASEEIRAGAAEAGVSYLRLSRDTGHNSSSDTEIYFDDLTSACRYIEENTGKVLLMTGSKDLVKIAGMISDKERLCARVLPTAKSIAACEEAGLKGSQIIAMQGPFSAELNTAMLKSTGASYLLTKETGAAGGFGQKLSAARDCNVTALIIRNPEGSVSGVMGAEGRRNEVFSFEEILEKLSELTGTDLKAETGLIITLAGIGPGSRDYMTEAVIKAVEKADVVFGARRIVEALKGINPSALYLDMYRSEDILRYLEENGGFKRPVVAYSGDTGFYSGAVSMLELVEKTSEGRIKCEVLSGISSISYFCSKAGISYQDSRLISRHGRECNVVGVLRKFRKCFLLVSSVEDVNALGEELENAEEEGVLRSLEIIYGYQLSYPEEEIRKVTASGLKSLTRKGLYILCLRHEAAALLPSYRGFADSEFIRGSVPMTKEEIRQISIRKLQLHSSAILYDIGAGTGSVSVEAALLAEEGRVFSIEYKDVAVDLIEKNRNKFCVSNLEIVKGKAPEAMKGLPAPTHAFIGGSGGNMAEILKELLRLNPSIRVVLNCIALETLSEVQEALRELPFYPAEYIQIMANRAEAMGRCHLLMSQNPIFIVSFTGNGEGI